MSSLARIVTGDKLDAMDFPPLRWAVPGLVPEGFGLLTGAPKMGKSWLVLDLSLAVASGGKALGRLRTGEPRPVLYLALEDGLRRLQSRARQLLGQDEAVPELIHFLTDSGSDPVLEVIGEWLRIHAGSAPVVCLDTLGKVTPAAGPGESAYQRDYRVGTALKRRIDEHPGSTLLAVHHTRKASSEDWMDSTSGTNGLNGAADFTINLSRRRHEGSGILRVTGRDVPEGEYAVTTSSGRWTLDGSELVDAARKAAHERAAEGVGDRSAEILRVVSEHPEGVSPAEVGSVLGMPGQIAGTYLGRLADAGRIARAKRGIYAPVESVESVETLDDESARFHTFHTFNTLTDRHPGFASSVECIVCGREVSAPRQWYGKRTCLAHEGEELP